MFQFFARNTQNKRREVMGSSGGWAFTRWQLLFFQIHKPVIRISPKFAQILCKNPAKISPRFSPGSRQDSRQDSIVPESSVNAPESWSMFRNLQSLFRKIRSMLRNFRTLFRNCRSLFRKLRSMSRNLLVNVPKIKVNVPESSVNVGFR